MNRGFTPDHENSRASTLSESIGYGSFQERERFSFFRPISQSIPIRVPISSARPWHTEFKFAVKSAIRQLNAHVRSEFSGARSTMLSMAQLRRVVAAGCPRHIAQRGNRRRDVFYDVE